jgi:hypothetical protein
MKSKNSIVFVSSLALLALTFASPIAMADAPPVGTQIASCTVTQAELTADVGSVVKVYQLNDAAKTVTVTLGQPGAEVTIAADSADFSADGNTLTMRVGRVIEIVIPKGQNQIGKMGNAGSGTDTMNCSSTF